MADSGNKLQRNISRSFRISSVQYLMSYRAKTREMINSRNCIDLIPCAQLAEKLVVNHDNKYKTWR